MILINIAVVTLLVMIPGVACQLFSQENPVAQENPATQSNPIGIYVESFMLQDASDAINKCKYCGRFFKAGEVRRDAESIVENLVKEGLDYRKIQYEGGKENRRCLHVYIYKFEERQGRSFAVEKPAGAGFHMHFFEEGMIRRVFVFDEDQRPLSENIFGFWKFLKRGGKWITVEALSEEGVEKGLDLLSEDLK